MIYWLVKVLRGQHNFTRDVWIARLGRLAIIHFENEPCCLKNTTIDSHGEIFFKFVLSMRCLCQHCHCHRLHHCRMADLVSTMKSHRLLMANEVSILLYHNVVLPSVTCENVWHLEIFLSSIASYSTVSN